MNDLKNREEISVLVDQSNVVFTAVGVTSTCPGDKLIQRAESDRFALHNNESG